MHSASPSLEAQKINTEYKTQKNIPDQMDCGTMAVTERKITSIVTWDGDVGDADGEVDTCTDVWLAS